MFGDVIRRNLTAQPVTQLLDAAVERHSRFVTETLTRKRDVCKTVANVDYAVVVSDMWFEIRAIKHRGHTIRNLADRVRRSAADVKNLILNVRSFQRQSTRLRDVFYRNKIASLQSVFENDRRVVVQQSRREDCEHA